MDEARAGNQFDLDQNGKKKNLTTKIFCLTRLLGIEGEIKSFPDKQKLEDFTTIKLSSHTQKKSKGTF